MWPEIVAVLLGFLSGILVNLLYPYFQLIVKRLGHLSIEDDYRQYVINQHQYIYSLLLDRSIDLMEVYTPTEIVLRNQEKSTADFSVL